MNVLSYETQRSVIHLLVEGNSIRSIERLTGVHRDSIMRLMVRVGNKCRDLLDKELMGLKLRHLQCDEVWTFVKKKQRRIQPGENPATIGDQYLYVALDEDTKLIASFAVGKRNSEVTEAFMMDLAKRIVTPEAVPEYYHQPIDKPQISTDGFAPYPDAVDLAFANTVKYGVLVKNYLESDQPGRYAPPKLSGADRRAVQGIDDESTICTSHVERGNLTIRTFMRRFTRLSLGFSKKLENLAAAIALHVAHYNFCRRHSTIRRTPAMAAKVTNTLWTLDDLLREIYS